MLGILVKLSTRLTSVKNQSSGLTLTQLLLTALIAVLAPNRWTIINGSKYIPDHLDRKKKDLDLNLPLHK